MKTTPIPVKEISQYIKVDPTTASGLRWIQDRSSNAKAGDQAGSLHKTDGYHQIKFSGKNYPAHRVVWCLAHKSDVPEGYTVDHIDNDRSNNHISNLQIVSHRHNLSKDRKGSSSFNGVGWYKPRSKWQAKIRFPDKQKHLGYYEDEEDAALAYNAALLEAVDRGLVSPRDLDNLNLFEDK